MKTEPTVIVEAVRTLLLLATSFGLLLSQEQKDAILAAIPAVFAVVSIGLAWYNRSKVYAPVTVQKIADAAAATGVPDIGTPPAG